MHPAHEAGISVVPWSWTVSVMDHRTPFYRIQIGCFGFMRQQPKLNLWLTDAIHSTLCGIHCVRNRSSIVRMSNVHGLTEKTQSVIIILHLHNITWTRPPPAHTHTRTCVYFTVAHNENATKNNNLPTWHSFGRHLCSILRLSVIQIKFPAFAWAPLADERRENKWSVQASDTDIVYEQSTMQRRREDDETTWTLHKCSACCLLPSTKLQCSAQNYWLYFRFILFWHPNLRFED